MHGQPRVIPTDWYLVWSVERCQGWLEVRFTDAARMAPKNGRHLVPWTPYWGGFGCNRWNVPYEIGWDRRYGVRDGPDVPFSSNGCLATGSIGHSVLAHCIDICVLGLPSDCVTGISRTSLLSLLCHLELDGSRPQPSRLVQLLSRD